MSLANKAMKPFRNVMLTAAMALPLASSTDAQAQSFSPGFGAAGRNTAMNLAPAFTQQTFNPGSANLIRGSNGNFIVPRFNNFGRPLGQGLAQPQFNNFNYQLNTPGFQGNFNQRQNFNQGNLNQRQSFNQRQNFNQRSNSHQAQISRPDPTIEIRRKQLENRQLSEDRRFSYVNNLIMEKKNGELYYSEYMMIFPLVEGDFDLSWASDRRMGHDKNGNKFFLVKAGDIETQRKKEVAASPNKTATSHVEYLYRCCCCCN